MMNVNYKKRRYTVTSRRERSFKRIVILMFVLMLCILTFMIMSRVTIFDVSPATRLIDIPHRLA